MRVAKYKGGMFGEGSGETLSCCLCGCMDYDRLTVQRIGIAVGMVGAEYSFCDGCWFGPNLGKRILQMLNYPDGLTLLESRVEVSEIQDAR